MQMKIGDKIVECEVNENGVPVIKATTETITRPDGSQDVIVNVPCIQICSEQKENKE